MEVKILISYQALAENSSGFRFRREALRSLITLEDSGFNLIVISESDNDDSDLLSFVRDGLSSESVNLNGVFSSYRELISAPGKAADRVLSVNENFQLFEISESKGLQGETAPILLFEGNSWKDLRGFLTSSLYTVTHNRKTAETDIRIKLNIRGEGRSSIKTGLGFFDHMLEQIAKHGGMDLDIVCKGDLHVDEHHTVEDTGIALGEAFLKAIGNRRGMERYGFALPMDEAEARVLIDLGGRNWIVWEAEFRREKIGDMPTEMFFHFFKSFSDAAKCNLHIVCKGDNEHHKIEAIFKAFARALRMAVRKDPFSNYLPSTKGVF